MWVVGTTGHKATAILDFFKVSEYSDRILSYRNVASLALPPHRLKRKKKVKASNGTKIAVEQKVIVWMCR